MERSLVALVLAVVCLCPFTNLLSAGDKKAQDNRKLMEEERADPYKKWINEDVKYIAQPEERAVFKELTTDEEKQVFIEDFWHLRDPDKTTATNEFKEEHYRRIAYANERFASGVPGWMTDRGRIYIIHGEPTEIERHPSGGRYSRPMHEGGGETSTFAFEIWRYRHVGNVGEDVELEFVDPSGSGEYRLARNPWEKDALLHVPGAGPTLGEQMGLIDRKDHPYFNPGGSQNYPFLHERARDNPFERMETYSRMQQPVPIKYRELQELVNVTVRYAQLPVEVRQDFLKLNDSQVLVPVTVEIANKELTFREENGIHNARLAVYGIVRSVTDRVVLEFDHDIMASYRSADLETGLQARSVYQKMIPLDWKLRYRLDLVVKDLNSGKTGVKTVAIIPPNYGVSRLALSSLILSTHVQKLPSPAEPNEMFVVGDLKIRPDLRNRFPLQNQLRAYVQLYNVGLDQSTLAPALTVSYRISRDSQPVVEWIEQGGESVDYFSQARVILLKTLRTENLEPGRYQLAVDVRDQISNQSTSVSQEFELVE